MLRKTYQLLLSLVFHDFQFSTAKERFSQTPWLISVVRPSILTLCILWMLWWIISNFVGTWRLIIVSTIWNLNFCFNFNAAHCRRTHRTRNPKGYVSSESNLGKALNLGFEVYILHLKISVWSRCNRWTQNLGKPDTHSFDLRSNLWPKWMDGKCDVCRVTIACTLSGCRLNRAV
jgi:hypothetical protein